MTDSTEMTPSTGMPVDQLQAPAIPAGILKQRGKNVAELMLFDAGLFNRLQEWGKQMSQAKSMVPAHLQGNASDCSAVIMQALRWGLDPYACAQKTHIIKGVLGYEAQLINAVLLTNAPIEGRPKYTKTGDWGQVIGKFKEVRGKTGGTYQVKDWTLEDEKGLGVSLEIKLQGEELQPFELLLSQASVRNSTLWASDPYQQLCYLAIKRWARLYCPDVIMGMYSPDELAEFKPIAPVGADKAKNVTPRMSPADQFTANRTPIVKREAKPTETPIAACDPATGEVAPEGSSHAAIIIKAPPGSTPPRVACLSVEDAAKKMVKAIGARYQKGNQEEINWIMKNNEAILVRIQHEQPEEYKTIQDLCEVPTDTPQEGGLL